MVVEGSCSKAFQMRTPGLLGLLAHILPRVFQQVIRHQHHGQFAQQLGR